MTDALSIGKYRALQKASTQNHIFTILAIDHQDSLRRALNTNAPEAVTEQQMVAFKQRVVTTLWDTGISGVLLDPVYGIAQLVNQGLPASVGLLAELEKADYNMNPLPLAVDIRPGWSVNQIKRMSADGVKLFYYYDPDNAGLCQQQDMTIQAVVNNCATYDIPLYAEPIITAATAENRQHKIIESARRSDELGADILKLEFPVDSHQYPDRAQWRAACEALTQSLSKPWVLLSAGVSYDIFCEQVEIACRAGACGFMVGRAIWGETCAITDAAGQETWLQITGRDRMKRLIEIAGTHASSWTDYYHLNDTSTDWYTDYSELT
ncbi:MAG: tagatose 1,6-diphosphate aldolase [Aggregatilineales bacterium]